MANEYDGEALNEMCSKVDLLEYASKSMNFEKRGIDSYAAHCCLHVDKTPSLVITPSKNLFHCFSCGCGGNILNWLMTFENMSFNDAVDKVATLVGADVKNLKQCSALKIYKNIFRISNEEKEKSINNRTILDISEIEKYRNGIPNEWVAEGISPEIMQKYNIRIDDSANRIVYPIYDNDLNLIGFKGRTRFKNYKAMKINKYQNYQKIGTTDFFVGMKENLEDIKEKNEAIIFEGIKSGLKLSSFGCDNNWLAAETSYLNAAQIKILIEIKIKNVVIAFDNDVEIKKILNCIQILKRFCNVYVITDRRRKKDRLLTEDKMSPVDAGIDVWETLYNEKIKV